MYLTVKEGDIHYLNNLGLVGQDNIAVMTRPTVQSAIRRMAKNNNTLREKELQKYLTFVQESTSW